MQIIRPRASSILVKGCDDLSFHTTLIFSPPETSILTSIMVIQVYITINYAILYNLFNVSELLFLHLYIGVHNFAISLRYPDRLTIVVHSICFRYSDFYAQHPGFTCEFILPPLASLSLNFLRWLLCSIFPSFR